MPPWLTLPGSFLLVVVLVKTIATVALATRYHRSQVWRVAGREGRTDLSVSVLVPAFNEAVTIETCLQSLALQTYERLDVLVVDDGSNDGTSEKVAEAITRFGDSSQMSLVRKSNGGKASALNLGIGMTSSDVVVCVDADSVLAPDAVERIVEPFEDATVGAVGGVVKVADCGTLLGRQQAMEYIAGLGLQRAAFARINAVQVLPGAISAFRRDVLQSLGGYSSDTVVEDFDATVAVQAAGFQAVVHPHAVAHTEGAATLSDLVKQRRRWAYGGFQVLAKYRRALFTRDFGPLSRFGLPYFLIFPWVDVAVSAIFIAGFAASAAAGRLGQFGIYLLATSVLVLALNLLAIRMSSEAGWLACYGALQPFFYAHVLTFATVMAGVSYARGRSAKWDKLERRGLNVNAERPHPPGVAGVRDVHQVA